MKLYSGVPQARLIPASLLSHLPSVLSTMLSCSKSGSFRMRRCSGYSIRSLCNFCSGPRNGTGSTFDLLSRNSWIIAPVETVDTRMIRLDPSTHQHPTSCIVSRYQSSVSTTLFRTVSVMCYYHVTGLQSVAAAGHVPHTQIWGSSQ